MYGDITVHARDVCIMRCWLLQLFARTRMTPLRASLGNWMVAAAAPIDILQLMTDQILCIGQA